MHHWQDYRSVIGIDEVGRGPLAGPVAVGAVSLAKNQKQKASKFLKGIQDSKQLSPNQREEWFIKLMQAYASGSLDYAVSFVTSQRIDRIGIAPAIHSALARTLSKLAPPPEHSLVLLDGGLKAPQQFIHQQTIIRGDSQEPLIAAASIIAKVLRDRRMTRYAKQYPDYGFEEHKGYGTLRHREALRTYGMTPLHRVSFCTNYC